MWKHILHDPARPWTRRLGQPTDVHMLRENRTMYFRIVSNNPLNNYCIINSRKMGTLRLNAWALKRRVSFNSIICTSGSAG